MTHLLIFSAKVALSAILILIWILLTFLYWPTLLLRAFVAYSAKYVLQTISGRFGNISADFIEQAAAFPIKTLRHPIKGIWVHIDDQDKYGESVYKVDWMHILKEIISAVFCWVAILTFVSFIYNGLPNFGAVFETTPRQDPESASPTLVPAYDQEKQEIKNQKIEIFVRAFSTALNGSGQRILSAEDLIRSVKELQSMEAGRHIQNKLLVDALNRCSASIDKEPGLFDVNEWTDMHGNTRAQYREVCLLVLDVIEDNGDQEMCGAVFETLKRRSSIEQRLREVSTSLCGTE